MKIDSRLKAELLKLSSQVELYWAGGPVRDLMLQRPILDIDLVLPENAIDIAKRFAQNLDATLIVLDDSHGVARVVSDGCILDFSEFREGATSIEEDLLKRDITINAMALAADKALMLYEKTEGTSHQTSALPTDLIDPSAGAEDLARGIIRAVSKHNLEADPLRLVRVFRFAAELGFAIAPGTFSEVRRLSPLILYPAPERINTELVHILETENAGKTFFLMYEAGLLSGILPELDGLAGVEQPGFHHLDVLEHCFETLRWMDRLVCEPVIAFPQPEQFNQWLTTNRQLVHALKWTAFMHDWGKPAQKGEKNGRVTFYNHDRTGAEMAREVASRLRWSREIRDFVASMVEMHMRPFHLLPDFRAGGPSKRALRKLVEATGIHYPALFLQAMADSKAGCGPLKPETLDIELAGLAARVHEFYLKRLQPARRAPRLLSGTDIMEMFGLEPSPLIGKVLKAVEAARIEGRIRNRKEAMELAKRIVAADGEN